MNKRVLITRDLEKAVEFKQILASAGTRVICVPLIVIQPRQDPAIEQAASQINHYDWVIFTSSNAVRLFVPKVKQHHKSRPTAHIMAVGPATAEALASRGWPADRVPDEYRAEGVVASLSEAHPNGLEGVRVLFPAAAAARQVIPRELAARGATVESLLLYDTVAPAEARQQLARVFQQGSPDVVAFTSGSTVRHYQALRPSPIREPLYAAIGPSTAQVATETGLKIEIQPVESTLPALARAILDYWDRDRSID